MKKLFKVLSVLLVAIVSLTSMAGCDFNPNDVNNVVDNFFENYQNMGKTETGAYSKFKDINVQSSYIGYGYDVINSPYMDPNEIDKRYPILDMQKIENANLIMEKSPGDAGFKSSEGTTIEEFYDNYSSSLGVGVNVGKYFSLAVGLGFSGAEKEATHRYFLQRSYTVNAFSIEIAETDETLQQYLSENFKNDLKSLNVDELFERYGTHLIREATMGGRIEQNISYYSTNTQSSSSFKLAVNAHANIMKVANVDVEEKHTSSQTLENSNIEFKMDGVQRGGKRGVNLSSEAPDFAEWAKSFDESLEYATLNGISNEKSLVGIWNFLPEGYSERATEIENKFNELVNEAYATMSNKFKTIVPNTSWDTIKNYMHRENCAKDNDYNPNSKETNTIWLSRHDAFELGILNLYGCEKVNNNYKLKNANDFSIKYQLLQNIDNLPQNDSDVHLAKIESDTATKVTSTNINKKTIGRGAYWVRVTYTDDTQKEFNQTNFLDAKSKGSYIELIDQDDLNSNKIIDKIEVVVVYELYTGGPGFLGIWWKEYTNWRCSFTYNFV